MSALENHRAETMERLERVSLLEGAECALISAKDALALERAAVDTEIDRLRAELDDVRAALDAAIHAATADGPLSVAKRISILAERNRAAEARLHDSRSALDAAGVPALVDLPGGAKRGLGFGERIDRLAARARDAEAVASRLRGAVEEARGHVSRVLTTWDVDAPIRAALLEARIELDAALSPAPTGGVLSCDDAQPANLHRDHGVSKRLLDAFAPAPVHRIFTCECGRTDAVEVAVFMGQPNVHCGCGRRWHVAPEKARVP